VWNAEYAAVWDNYMNGAPTNEAAVRDLLARNVATFECIDRGLGRFKFMARPNGVGRILCALLSGVVYCVGKDLQDSGGSTNVPAGQMYDTSPRRRWEAEDAVFQVNPPSD